MWWGGISRDVVPVQQQWTRDSGNGSTFASIITLELIPSITRGCIAEERETGCNGAQELTKGK